MLEGQLAHAIIGARFIGVEHGADFDVLNDHALDRLPVGVLNRHCNSAATALAHSKNCRLADRATPRVALLRLVLILFDPADVALWMESRRAV